MRIIPHNTINDLTFEELYTHFEYNSARKRHNRLGDLFVSKLYRRSLILTRALKLTTTILSDFINDFKIEVSEFGACFDAIVNFNLPLQSFNIRTEVHMEAVFSDRIDTIYLLNPAILKYKMPTFFNDVNHRFLYLSRTGLIITGNMELIGAYSVSIFPKSYRCTKKTWDELRAKKLN